MQSVTCLSQESEVLDLFGHLLLFARRAVVSYWRKYVHLVLVKRLGGLGLPRNSKVRLTDCPDMTMAVHNGCKATK